MRIKPILLGLFLTLVSVNTALARAGGGGSSSGGGGGGSFGGGSSGGMSSSGGGPEDAWTIVGIIAFALIVMGAMIYKNKKALEKTKADVAVAAKADPRWDEARLLQRVDFVFTTFQKAWSDLDTKTMQTILTPEYYKRMVLEISVLNNLHRKNIMEGARIITSTIVQMEDATNNAQDKFSVRIQAKAKDVLWDEKNNKELYHENCTFMEYWHFVRQGDDWVLDRITQATAKPDLLDTKISEFADKNGFYFDPDFGWLMLPQKGVLFSKATFLKSDVNNHVVGYYKNKIVEFYTYIPKANGGDAKSYYLIAQAVLPIHHTDIVVERKKLINWPKPGLRRMSLESVDFNNKFCLWAHPDDMSRPLELLTPNFMEKIYNLPIEINIEVVDNVVYFFAKNKGPQNYEQMLEVLSWAFDEMKM